MTGRKDANHVEAKRWLEQAERDLEAAESNQRAGYHEWACFLAQQAAEKALKSTSGTPGQFYEAKDAEECRALAREIVAFVKKQSGI